MVQTAVSFFFDYPKGLRDLLVYTKEKYNDPPIYITETGMSNSVISFHCTKFLHMHALETIKNNDLFKITK